MKGRWIFRRTLSLWDRVRTLLAPREIGSRVEELIEVVPTTCVQRLKNDPALIQPFPIHRGNLAGVASPGYHRVGNMVQGSKGAARCQRFGKWFGFGGGFFLGRGGSR